MKKQDVLNHSAKLIIEQMEQQQQQNAWDRLKLQQSQCGFGLKGICCRACAMGPCRIKSSGQLGVCGANADTIVARNFLRAVAAGTASHCEHGRAVAELLMAIATGTAKDYRIKNPNKLYALAKEWKIATDDRTLREVALDVAEVALAEFGKPDGYQLMVARAPQRRQQVWQKTDVTPRAMDREVVEAMHRSSMGTDQDYKSLLRHASRVALADGWSGAMLATEVQDIIFGSPFPKEGSMDLGVLQENQVNIVIHGHEPILPEKILEAAKNPELLAKSKQAGVEGINVVGICCTANELLMRHGVPIAGNFMSQELALATGSVEMMVLDMQCIMQGLAQLSSHYHTLLVTTSVKAKIPNTIHIPIDQTNAAEKAVQLVSMAIDNFKNRRSTNIPKFVQRAIAGFSHESIELIGETSNCRGYGFLNDLIIKGTIKGIAAVIGCSSAKTFHQSRHVNLVRELIKDDILVITTGCASISCGTNSLLDPDNAIEFSGPGLTKLYQQISIPPVLACGSCVDNSRLLMMASEIVKAGRLGDDLSQLPLAGACLEAMHEKSFSIGQYFVASGILTVFAEDMFPFLGSENICNYLTSDIEHIFGGRWAFESNPMKAAKLIKDHIMKQRNTLGLEMDNKKILSNYLKIE